MLPLGELLGPFAPCVATRHGAPSSQPALIRALSFSLMAMRVFSVEATAGMLPAQSSDLIVVDAPRRAGKAAAGKRGAPSDEMKSGAYSQFLCQRDEQANDVKVWRTARREQCPDVAR